jgi:tetratricopeptide (TPR) repeat protein
MILGVLLIHQRFPVPLRWGLFLVCALNLICPAKHAVSNWTEDISAFPTELDHARHPPAVLDPAYYTYSNDAVSFYKQGRFPEALAQADRAVQLHPDFPDALYNRAVIRAASGNDAGAVSDVMEALRVAPANWPGRATGEAFLAALRARAP